MKGLRLHRSDSDDWAPRLVPTDDGADYIVARVPKVLFDLSPPERNFVRRWAQDASALNELPEICRRLRKRKSNTTSDLSAAARNLCLSKEMLDSMLYDIRNPRLYD